jgi:hypothetical protein
MVLPSGLTPRSTATVINYLNTMVTIASSFKHALHAVKKFMENVRGMFLKKTLNLGKKVHLKKMFVCCFSQRVSNNWATYYYWLLNSEVYHILTSSLPTATAPHSSPLS